MKTPTTARSRPSKNGAGGRPPKFREARRPITVTLPERVLTKLAGVNHDRARAIVACVEAVAGSGENAKKPVELVEVVPGKALIVVGPCRALRKITWLRLVEISPARFLLVLPTGTPVDSLEVAILDLIEKQVPGDPGERSLLEELRTLIRSERRRKAVTKAELVFVDI